MSRADVRRDLMADLSLRPATEHDEGQFARFVRWCEANGETVPSPGWDDSTAEQLVLEFLYSESHRWQYSTQCGYVTSLRKVLLPAGINIVGPRLSRYLAHERRRLPARPAPLTDAIELGTVHRMAELMAADDGEDVEIVRRRGCLAVYEALGEDPFASDVAVRLPSAAFRFEEHRIVIRWAAHRAIIDAGTSAERFAALAQALQGGSDRECPLADPSRAPGAALKNDRRAFARALTRSGALSGRKAPASSDRDGWLWWMRFLDADLRQRRRCRAYLLAGIVTANRHADMQNLRMCDVVEGADGYVLCVVDDKGRKLQRSAGIQRARPDAKFIAHARSADGSCFRACPACAMGQHLEVRERDGAGQLDPVFRGDGSSDKALTAVGASAMLIRYYTQAGGSGCAVDGEPTKIGTRSLRVTAVTEALRAGISILDVASSLTLHESIRTTAVYDRSHCGHAAATAYGLSVTEPASA